MFPSSGSLTFLMTDIEGSTKLWELHPDEMRLALLRHEELAYETIESFGGRIVRSKGEGDSLFAVFSKASTAILAASELQLRFQTEAWPESAQLKVRMAIHSGPVDERDGDFFGSTINRCARIRALAYGRQVLVSLASSALARPDLDSRVSLVDLGMHRLKDLQAPEQLFQLTRDGIQREFEPLKSVDSVPNNLPAQTTSFVGRESELSEMAEAFSRTRLLTIIGSGGCGKTRAALQFAADRLDEFHDGVWMVELSTLGDPALVEDFVARAIGIGETPGQSTLDALIDYVKGRRCLIILDNCEHLIAGAAELVEHLVPATTDLKFICTSREPLALKGESTYRMPSLKVPAEGNGLPADEAAKFEAIRLFTERATLSDHRFVLTDEIAPSVAEICRRLDGIPLAIELAAARVRVLSPEQISARLDDRFRLLTGGSRDVLPRQQTLRAVIDWGYELLTDAERTLHSRLAIFRGGFQLECAEVVCSDEVIDEYEVLELLSRLVDKSLVVADESPGDDKRYRLLESLREYGYEKLVEAGEADRIAQRHLDYFMRLSEQAETELTQPHQAEWMRRMDAERDNFRFATEWVVAHMKSTSYSALGESLLRMTGALSRYWFMRGLLKEGRRLLQEALRVTEGHGKTIGWAKSCNGAGILAWRQRDLDDAERWYEASLTAWESLGEKKGIASSLSNLGLLSVDRGQLEQARAFHERGLAIRKEINDKFGLANSYNNLGILCWEMRDIESAKTYYEECVTIRRQLGDRAGMSDTLCNLGLVYSTIGDLEKARSLYLESLESFRQLGNIGSMAYVLMNLGIVHHRQQDYAAATSALLESQKLCEDLGDQSNLVYVGVHLGMVEILKGDLDAASRYLIVAFDRSLDPDGEENRLEAVYAVATLLTHLGKIESAVRVFGFGEQMHAELGAKSSYEPEMLVISARDRCEAILADDFNRVLEEGAEMSPEELVLEVRALHPVDAEPRGFGGSVQTCLYA